MRKLGSVVAACAVWIVLGAAPARAIPEAGYAERFDAEVLPFCLGGWQYGSFTGAAGAEIAYASYRVDHPRGALVIVPGRSEPFLRYCEVVYDLRDAGYDIYLIDHRGQGWSDRLLTDRYKGYVRYFADYVADLHAFVSDIVKPAGYDRIVALGHSMGGGIVTFDAELHPDDFTSLILSAPLHAINTQQFAMPVAWLLARGATLIGQGAEYAQGQTPPDPEAPFSSSDVTHSQVRWQMRTELVHLFPELLGGGATYRWVREGIEASAAIRLWAFTLHMPILLFQAGQETYVENWGQDEVCSRAADCEQLRLPDAFHEILLERDELRDLALTAIRAFLAR